jgi:phosphatidyl-myo-inositol alpha-mannosyltransferase
VRHAVKSSRAPVIATFHCYSERDGWAVRLVRRMGALRLRRLAGAIAVSDHAADYAGRIYSGPIQIIPNGVDVSRFAGRPRTRRRHAPGEPLRVLFVGRHGEPRKGLAVLLEAAARLRARGAACEVQVVGEGPSDRFGALAGRANARFAGRVDDAELARQYAESDVFCAPSLGGESFGMVLTEAMAAGCPVVASDIPGYRQASSGAALLAPPGDAAALAAALERLSGSADLRARMSEAGVRRAAELDWPHVGLRIRAFYAAIVEEVLPAALGAIA